MIEASKEVKNKSAQLALFLMAGTDFPPLSNLSIIACSCHSFLAKHAIGEASGASVLKPD